MCFEVINKKEFNVLTVNKTDTVSLPKKQNYYVSHVDSYCLYEKRKLKSSENFHLKFQSIAPIINTTVLRK